MQFSVNTNCTAMFQNKNNFKYMQNRYKEMIEKTGIFAQTLINVFCFTFFRLGALPLIASTWCHLSTKKARSLFCSVLL